MKWNSNHDRCTKEEMRQLFAGSQEQLHWLCHTLTGDERLSGQAVEAALRQSLRGSGHVFPEWMAGWARRLMIKFCIATLRPAAGVDHAHRGCACQEVELEFAASGEPATLLNASPEALQQALLRLDVLPRFVFVLRAVEGYSRRDAALLLNIDDRLCELAYSQATKTLHAHMADSARPERWSAADNDACLGAEQIAHSLVSRRFGESNFPILTMAGETA